MTRMLASRVFSWADQHMFAEASGDRNPLHLDPAVASRTQAGAPVVHGIHALIWALDALAAKPLQGRSIRRGRAQFVRFAYLDRQVDLQLTDVQDGRIGATLSAAGSTITTLSLELGAPEPAAEDNPYLGAPPTLLGAEPMEPSEAEMAQARGWLQTDASAGALTATYPALAAAIGPQRVTALAGLSAVVGMACPGLHSIFSAVDFEVLEERGEPAGFGWAARRPDPRYGRIEIAAHGGGLRMQARTLIRPGPVAPPTMQDAAAAVAAGEFAHRRAVVVGGSRGLGAAVAKLLAAGGGHVTVTCASHTAEAEAVAGDIRGARGTDAAHVLRLDVLAPLEPAAEEALRRATHVYYFATPHIARQGGGTFDAETFGLFSRIYLEAFHDLCARTATLSTEEKVRVLYPSTVFVEERPKGMTEYAMAKAAGELLCADLMRAHPRLEITAPRIPRVLTDQTALAIPVKTLGAMEAMLPLLRAEA